jgi:hypothetical protein
MPELNHWNNKNQNQRSSSFYPADENDRFSGKCDPLEASGFSQKSSFGDSPDHDESNDFSAHVITRMPDLTGFGGDSAIQSISLYRPKGNRRWPLKWGGFRNISMQKWCASAAIALVVLIVVWSIFRNPVEPLDIVVQNEASVTVDPPISSRESTIRRDASHFVTPQASNGIRFSSENSSQMFPAAESRNASNIGQGQFFHTGSYDPQYSPSEPYAANMTAMPDAAIVTPDPSLRELSPWEHRPNTDISTAQNMQSQFGPVVGYNTPQQTGMPENNWPNGNPGNNQFAGSSPQTQNGAINMGYEQMPYSADPSLGFASMASYNGPAQGTVHPGYMPVNGVGGGYAQIVGDGQPNGVPQFGNMAIASQGVSPSFGQQPGQEQGAIVYHAGTYPPHQGQNHIPANVAPQEMYYHQQPSNHDNAVAINSHAIPSYGQGQLPQQQNYNGNPQYGVQQNNTQPNGNQTSYSNVPVVSSNQSYRDQAAMGSGMTNQNTQYPGGPYTGTLPTNAPYDNTMLSRSPDYYR